MGLIYLFIMYSKIAVAATLVASAFGAHPAPYHPAPAPYHAPAPAPYHAPAYKAPHHAPATYDESPKPFAFEYGVADDYSGAKFNAAETTDGKTLSGSYSVNLPDGRIQTVTYTADPYGYGGYVADVAYSGEPHYPEYKPHPAPAYKPAPVYHKPAPYHA